MLIRSLFCDSQIYPVSSLIFFSLFSLVTFPNFIVFCNLENIHFSTKSWQSYLLKYLHLQSILISFFMTSTTDKPIYVFYHFNLKICDLY